MRTMSEEAAAGAAAGIAGTLLGFPLDTVKARLQTGASSSALSCVRGIAQREGFRGFYRGVASPLLSCTVLNTLAFQTYALTRTLVALPPVAPPAQREAPVGSFAQRFAAGALIAPLVTAVSTPFEFVKVQLQLDDKPVGSAGAAKARRFEGAAHAMRAIAKQNGVAALWLGGGTNLVREALFLGTYFYANEGLHDALTQSGVGHAAAVPIAGGLSGACAWVISFPLDSIKNNVQGQRLEVLGTSAQLRTRDVAAALWARTGVRGLYKGILPSVLRAFLVSGSRFSAYEAVLDLLRDP